MTAIDKTSQARLTLFLIGIGTGNPDHITLEAIKALKAADLIIVPDKGDAKARLREVRHAIIEEHAPKARVADFAMPVRDAADPDYKGGVDRWHDAVAEAWKHTIETHLDPKDGGSIALLVWGDPSLYDSTLRIAERLARVWPIAVRVIPGLTSVQVLTAAHGIPLNEIGAAVLITTGRQLAQKGWPEGAETVVVLLDGETAFTKIEQAGVKIWWAAYLGLPQEMIISGPLPEVSQRIVEARAEARAKIGWIMDIYLLRR